MKLSIFTLSKASFNVATMLLKKHFFIIIYLFYASCFGQSLSYEHYTVKDGLPHDITYGMLEDSNGYIWIGTDDGLVRFDGGNFKVYGYEQGLQSNYVIDIVERKKDEYIIATWGRGIHYLKNDSIFKPTIKDDAYTKANIIEVIQNGLYAKTFSDNQFSTYNDSIRTTNYVIKENESRPYVVSTAPGVEKIRSTTESILDNKIYIHASGKSYYNKSIKGVFSFTNKKSKPSFKYLYNKYIYTIHKENDSLLYFGSKNCIYVGNEESLIERIDIPILKGENIISIKKNKDELYFITNNFLNSNRLIYKYNLTTKKIVSISNVLKIDAMVSDFLIDKNENIWISTYGNGVYVIRNTKNFFLGKETFFNKDLKDITIIDDDLIVLSTNSVYKLKNSKLLSCVKLPLIVERFYYDPRTEVLYIYNGEKPKDNIKLANNIGIKLKITNETLPEKFEKGEYKIYNKYYDLYIYYKGNLVKKISKGSNIIKLEIRDNLLYVLTERKELDIYNLKSGELIQKYHRKSNLNLDKVYDFILTKNNTLFIATNVGLYKIEKDGYKFYNKKDGLESNHINSILLDNYDVLWLATQKGLNVIVDEEVYTVDKSQGQESSFTTKVISANGFIYVAGNQGLFVHDNKKKFSPEVLPPLKVEQNESSFSLYPIDLINGKKLKVSYKLDDNEWKDTKNFNLNFNYLNQGKHKVAFRYKNSISKWTTSKKYTFQVLYPWYYQDWFYALIIGVGASFIILFLMLLLKKSKQRNNQLKETIEEKERLKKNLSSAQKDLAQDFHDELGNKLASITMLTNLLLMKMEGKNDTYNKLSKIKDDSNALYSGVKDFIWSLNSKNNNLYEVLKYLIEFGKNLFTNTSINFYTIDELNASLKEMECYGTSKQIIFIFKEAMTNVLKHSKASEVSLSFKMSTNEVQIILSDNGKGFDTGIMKRKNGLINMQSRAEKIGAILSIQTTIKKETKITLTLSKNN